MAADFADAALFKDGDGITEAAAAHPVGDIDRSLIGHQRIISGVEFIFADWVKRRGRFIQDDKRRILVQCAGNGNLLRFTPRNLNPALSTLL